MNVLKKIESLNAAGASKRPVKMVAMFSVRNLYPKYGVPGKLSSSLKIFISECSGVRSGRRDARVLVGTVLLALNGRSWVRERGGVGCGEVVVGLHRVR